MANYNKRRLVMLVVVIFIVVLSFFAGKHYGGHSYISPQNTAAPVQTGSERVGIPPDSLPH